MDFFARQHDLSRSSRHLLWWYAAIVVMLAASLGLTGMALIAYTAWSRPSFHPHAAHFAWAFAGGAGLALLTLAIVTALELRRLHRGVGALAASLGGTRIAADATDPAHRRLMNVVEEMALAAELPAPQVYLLADEPGINACVLAWHGRDAALCVTLGCLYRLRRAELQAVVAHGLSELLHDEQPFRMRLAALIGGLQALCRVGRYLLVPRRGDEEHRSLNPLLMVVYPLSAVIGLDLLICGSCGWLCGELLGAAVLRRRVLLGDADACQFTREPTALAAALAKVGGFVLGSRLLTRSARPLRHLFFCRTELPALSWFDAYPRLADRVRAVDPSWDGRFAPSRIDSALIDDGGGTSEQRAVVD